MATKRPQNKCIDCSYTWHPRGSDLSQKCARCHSPNVKKVETIGNGIPMGFAILAIGFVALLLFSGKGGDSSTNSQTFSEQSPRSQEDISGISSPSQHDVKPAENSTASSEVLSPNTRTPEIANTHNEIEPTIQETKSGDTDRIYSDEEILQMEDTNQYHGDDPIIRRRLGLPSRETGKLIH